VVCPVCEHVQESGTECEVCGRRLAGATPTPEASSPLEGLERTALQEGAGAGAGPPAPPVEGFEPSRFEPAAAAPAGEPGPPDGWLERTAAPEVQTATEPLEVERSTAERPRQRPGDAVPRPPPTCRYCRTPAVPGDAFCGCCGMKLPLERPAAASTAAPAGVPCRGCGILVTGPVCPACGARRREAEG
jgi:hypothetical protein